MSRGSRVRSPPGVVHGACSVMVIIGASQALDPGSIPGRRIAAFWGISSIGRVRALQARGTGIETPMLHFASRSLCFRRSRLSSSTSSAPEAKLGWPSGPRRSTQVRVSPEAWVRIPLQAIPSFLFCPSPTSPAPARAAGPTCTGHWSSGMILL